jgi:hypothetical protein
MKLIGILSRYRPSSGFWLAVTTLALILASALVGTPPAPPPGM